MGLTRSPQNINPIANTLKGLGANEKSIIAVLCNMAGESQWDPYAIEIGKENYGWYPPSAGWRYSKGVGLVQLSYTPANKQIYDYNQTHTTLESIQFQCQMLFNPPVQSWDNYRPESGRRYSSIIGFWTNEFNLSARELSADWFAHYERGDTRVYGFASMDYMSAGRHRYDLYANEVNANIHWGSVGGGGSVIDPPKPEPKPEPEPELRLLTMQECLALLDKAKPKPTSPPEVDPDKPPVDVPSVPTSDLGKAIQDCYNLFVSHGTRYSTYGYAIRYSTAQEPWIADCSSFVMACVYWIEHGNLNGYNGQGSPNTVGMQSVLPQKGWRKIRTGGNLAGDFKTGDIIIMGSGGGTGAHTIIMVTDTEAVEVQGGDGWYTYAMARRPITWHQTYNLPYFDVNYLYRKG